MVALDRKARLYIAAALAAAAMLEVFWVRWWGWGPGPSPTLVALLVCQTVLLTHFPVRLSPRYKADATPAVCFASLLILGPPLAVVVAGGSRLIGELTLLPRRNRRNGRRLATWPSAIFNASQLALATGLGGLALVLVEGQNLPLTPDSTRALLGVVAAAGGFYATSALLVAGMIGVHRHLNPLAALLDTTRLDLVESAALYSAGFLVAVTSSGRPWAALVITGAGAVVFVSLQRSVQLVEQTIEAVQALADVVDRRDPYTYEHSRRVAETATQIAIRMGLSDREVETIGLAARVHDLGKIGVPDRVLLKTGRLDDEEFDRIKEHPAMGAEILARFPRFRRGHDLVLSHHERLDGRGYPRALRGPQIPLGAQIIAVADSFDAMSSARPYRNPMPAEQVIQELRRGRGTQWNPEVVNALLATLGERFEPVAELRPLPQLAKAG